MRVIHAPIGGRRSNAVTSKKKSNLITPEGPLSSEGDKKRAKYSPKNLLKGEIGPLLLGEGG